MALFYAPEIASDNELPNEEAAHCLRTLRMSTGDAIDVTDGKGNLYKAEIDIANSKHCTVTLHEKIQYSKQWNGRLHIAVAPTKNMDRVEWLAEKATEIGWDELTFLECRFSERKIIKEERVEKILISAMKQSLKYIKPIVNPMTSFSKFVAMDHKGAKFIAHCYNGEKCELKDILNPGQEATILIGPEGDFSPEEVEQAIAAGFMPISLGNSRLRTETAALVACHTYILKNT